MLRLTLAAIFCLTSPPVPPGTTSVLGNPAPSPTGFGETNDCHHFASDKGYGGFCTLSGYRWFCRYASTGQTCSDSHGNRW